MGSTAGVGEGAVLAGAVVFDAVGADELVADADLDGLADDRDLNLAAPMFGAYPIVGAGEAHIARRVDFAGHRCRRGCLGSRREPAAALHAGVPPVPRVATKYPRIAQKHFAARGMQAEVIFVQGSVELAPVTGLADLIVDLVETGSTLRENGLEERETVCSISSLLVANRALFKLHHDRIAPLVEGLRRAVEASRPS